MNGSALTHNCIMCGEAFHPASLGIAICPKCGGPPEATPEQEVGKAIQLDVGLSNQHLEVPAQPHREKAAAQEGDMDASQVPLEWQSGDVILDLYEVLGELGRGGMGVVYKVRHRGWDMELAVKSPLRGALDRVGGEGEFIAEAETWIDLGLHPHIATCYYVRKLGPVPCLFAEYVQGGSLSQWIQKGKLRDLESILDASIQFAWGLDYAHQQGLTHKDVKPDNVLMTAGGQVKVTDFGQAKAKAGYTPAYCSPEQAAAQFDSSIQLTPATDMWSWALSILEVFAGSTYWVNPAMPEYAWGQVAPQALQDYMAGKVDEPAVSRMPERLSELLRECFRENPDERPESMGVAAECLVEIYQGEIGRPYPREMPKEVDLRADSLNNKALSLLDLGRTSKAEETLQQALKADPAHLYSTLNLDLIRWRYGKINDMELVKKLEKQRDLNFAAWEPQYMLGCVHIERGDYKSASQSLENIPERQAQNEEVILARKQLPTIRSKEIKPIFNLPRFKDDRVINYSNVNCLCISADGKMIVTGDDDHQIIIWNLENGSQIKRLFGHTRGIDSISLSADQRLLLSSADNIKLWQMESGNVILETDLGHGPAVLSRNGKYALIAHGRDCLLWSTDDGKIIRKFSTPTGIVNAVCLSSDNLYAISAGDEGDCNIRLWDTQTQQCIRVMKGHDDGITSLGLTRDNRLLLSASWDNTLKVWELATGNCLRTLKGHTGFILTGAIDPLGRYAISGSDDKTLRFWRIDNGQCFRTIKGSDEVDICAIDIRHDGCLAISSGGLPTVWQVDIAADLISLPPLLSKVISSDILKSTQLEVEQILKRAEQSFVDGCFTSAARLIRQVRSKPGFEREERSLQLWSRLSSLLPHVGLRGAWEALSLDFDSDLDRVAFSRRNEVIISGEYANETWDVKSKKKIAEYRSKKELRDALGPLEQDERYEVHVHGYELPRTERDSDDPIFELWDEHTNRCLRTFTGHTGGITRLIWSPDRRFILSGSRDRTLKIWEPANGCCLRTMEGHLGEIIGLSWSQDGHRILSADTSSIREWSADSGDCLRIIEAQQASNVRFSLDCNFSFDYAWDEIQVWDLRRKEKVLSFLSKPREAEPAHGDEDRSYIDNLESSRDGQYVLTVSGDNLVNIWYLDWELEAYDLVDWDEVARPYLAVFITRHTPYAAELPQDRQPTEEEISLALTRRGKPDWSEEDFQKLLYTLGCAGYGWLRPEGVRRELEEMAAERT